ncbi:putative glutamyl-tRNA amidotransferase subunit A [Rhizoctonia solani 123E]|uniref:Putative glutamyl-tRNA amidotransferase subunit A n=1 Tax=Rhizoctonia solani 123E TaxID=1423351 RepID=A0A074RW63_9AGAM|nr:putative glutamyl-tRNA amidotransferase subunit A [Rhizoctonia solani 123E]
MELWMILFLLFQLMIYVTGPPVTIDQDASCSKYPDLYEASIQELQNGLERGDYTSVDLVTAYLVRIDEVNYKGPNLRAVLEVNPHALEQAAELDLERRRRGKRSSLHGIPILIKDNIAIRASDGNTTAGSYALLGSIVPGDATVIAKLQEAGAILLGKANLSEWSYLRDFSLDSGWSGRGGQITNPYYPGADPSGSSAGSAVATAIGLAAAALGTETDGSIVSPSSYNNLVGIKPTVGLVSRAGVIPVSSHQDTVGPMTRSVADAAAILSIIAGSDNKDNYTHSAPADIPNYTRYLNVDSIKGKRFGVPRATFTNDSATGNHPSINVEFNEALAIIQSMGGIIVDPADIPSAAKLSRGDEMLIFQVDFKLDLNRYLQGLNYESTNATTLAGIIAYNNANEDLEKPEGYTGQALMIDAELTTGYNSTYYTALHSNYELGRDQGIDAALQVHALDALVLPTNDNSVHTPPVPLGFHPDDTPPGRAGPHTIFPAPGIPFGLAFIGTAYSEPNLISFAYAYEQRTQTRLRRRAYPLAVPKTQLSHVIDICSVNNVLTHQN